MAAKQCSKCGETKPVESFGICRDRGKTRVRGICKECVAKVSREGRRTGKYVTDKAKARERALRSCDARRNRAAEKRARGEKVVTVWDNIPNKVATAARRGKEYWPEGCRVDRPKPSKPPKRVKPWQGRGLSDAEMYQVRYRHDSVFREKEKLRQQMRRHANPRYAIQWAKHGTRWFRADQSDDGSITFDHLRWLRQDSQCAYCGAAIRSDNREFDHVQPLAKGGTHTADNLVVACRPCNRAKKDRTLIEWLQIMRDRLPLVA